MKKKTTTILLIFFSLFSCGIKQPVTSVDVSSTGHIFVTSDSIKSEIFLDGSTTNKITPDTLFNIPVGWHTIHVIKDGYFSTPDSLNVLVEKNKISQAKFELTVLIQSGLLFVETIPQRGEIFINDRITGKFTPDTVQLETGQYDIKIKKNGYIPLQWVINIFPDSLIHLQNQFAINQRVLLESFGNVSCAPCVDAANNLAKFSDDIKKTKFAIIDYFANWPNPNDPFYKAAPQDVNQRVQYYAITGLPTLQIDGWQNAEADNYSNILNIFNDAFSHHDQSFGLSVEKSFADGKLIINVEIYDFEKPLIDEQLSLFVAIIENEIHFDSPPGSNGLTDFDFVFRTFLSSNSGDTILDNSNTKKIAYSFTWQNWNYDNCQVIAYIQNIHSKQIIQSTIK